MLLGKKSKSSIEARRFDWSGTIFRSKIFWIILGLKLTATFFFAAPVLTELFIPFLEVFVASPSINVYQEFWRNGMDDNFPYPAIMLWTMSLPRLFFYWIGFDTLSINMLAFIYRIPLILADVAIFIILCGWLRRQTKLLLWLYWASPILFYINYLHGQLDVIALAFALLSVYFLFSNRWVQSALLLAVAVAAKMNLLLILPFALIFLWQQNRSFISLLSYLSTVCVTFILINLPYIFSDGFIQIVLLNHQQAKVGLITLGSSIDGVTLYVVPALLILLVFYSFAIQIRNRDIFLFFMGSAFGIILLFIPPAPGWYYWVLPFLIYFNSRLYPKFLLPLLLLQLAYFAYFSIIPESDFLSLLNFSGSSDGDETLYKHLVGLGVNAPLFVNLAFTFLQSLLLINTGFMLYSGVHIPQKSKIKARPFMIGVSGDSAAGKTRISNDIRLVLGTQHIGLVCGDDMHKWERGHTSWSNLTHLNPLANELHDELDFIKRLRQNKFVWRRHYDHETGRFTEKKAIKSRSIMVFEGLHSFYLKPSRDLFDLKVFMKPDASLLKHRKLLRDVQNRGAKKAKVFETIEARQSDLAQFIEVQEQHADIVISMFPIEKIAEKEIGKPDLEIREWLQFTVSNSYYLGSIVSDLIEAYPDDVRHFYDVQDRQVIEITKPPGPKTLSLLGEKYLVELETLGIYDPPWSTNWSGILQLLLIYCIFNGLEEQ